jgi:hypothetical protein
VFYVDVAKVDWDFTYVVMILHVCCKCLFLMFHLFFSDVCCKCAGSCICFIHRLQMFLRGCCIYLQLFFECFNCFVHMLQLCSFECFKSRLGVVHVAM